MFSAMKTQTFYCVWILCIRNLDKALQEYLTSTYSIWYSCWESQMIESVWSSWMHHLDWRTHSKMAPSLTCLAACWGWLKGWAQLGPFTYVLTCYITSECSHFLYGGFCPSEQNWRKLHGVLWPNLRRYTATLPLYSGQNNLIPAQSGGDLDPMS